MAERLTLTVPEVAELLRISRGAAYEAVRTGEIPSVRFGRTIRVPVPQLMRLLATQGEGDPAAAEPPSGPSSPRIGRGELT